MRFKILLKSATKEFYSQKFHMSVIKEPLQNRFAPVFCPSNTGRAVASRGCSLHNTLTLLRYLMTHTGAGPHALNPSHLYIRVRANKIFVCVLPVFLKPMSCQSK